MNFDGLSVTTRLDVTKVYTVNFYKDETYYCRFGFMDGNGLCVFLLEPSQISTSMANAESIWTEFYLHGDIRSLALNPRDIQQFQLVVAVMKEEKKVHRGIVLGFERDRQRCLLYCLEAGALGEFPSDILYATTELAAKSEFKGFPCILDNLRLFKGTKRLTNAFDEVNVGNSYHLKHGTMCKLLCKGHADGGRIPIFDFWPIQESKMKIMKMLRLAPPSYNSLMVNNCINHWSSELKPVGEIFTGSIPYCDEDGMVCIHLEGLDDAPAVYMEKFLKRFQVADLQNRFQCISKQSAEKGRRTGKIYVAEFSDDSGLYRATIVDVSDFGVNVQFIDYGNQAFVEFDKLFEAEGLDEVLTRIPQLVWEAYLYRIDRVLNVDEVNAYLQSQAELEFRVRDTKRNGLSVVSIMLKGEPGRNLVREMVEMGLVKALP